MDIKWTAQQMEAISARNCNLLVAAAAGSGKTAVLVERIIGRILDEKDPVDIDRLLIVTFTNAAANEMRDRIGDAILKRIDGLASTGDEKNYQWLKRQLVLLNKAHITTIHSFCQNVLRTYSHKLNIDPAYTVLDEIQSAIIKSEILDQLLDELYEKEENNKLFADLVECFGGSRSDEGLKDIILTILKFIYGLPFPEKWLLEKVEEFNVDLGQQAAEAVDFSSTSWGRIILDNFIFTLDNLVKQLQKAKELCQLDIYEKYAQVLQEDINLFLLMRQAAEESWDKTYGMLSVAKFAAFSKGRGGVTVPEEVKNIRENVKRIFNKYKDEYINIPSIKAFEDMKSMYPMLSKLASIIIEFDRRYKKYKLDRALIDFNDMEHYALEILAEKGENGEIAPSEAALAYRDYFVEVYTDEYQDSNWTQEIILSLIAKGSDTYGNRFMVGDVKQSIYRFRNARPDIFLKKYEDYSEDKKAPDRLVKLYKNFRSREDILGSVNYIFSKIMSRSAGEMDYNRNEYLYCGADYPASPSDTCCELLLGEYIGKKNQKKIEDDDLEGFEELENLEIPLKEQFEAMMVARKIQELVHGKLLEDGRRGEPFQVYDRKLESFRNVRYGDIVILMRSLNRNADIYQEVFLAQGIPVFWDAGEGFFLTREVQVIISLLKIIDNPCQDIPLLAVLLSPVGAFSHDEIADLRLYNKNALFYENLRAICTDENYDARAREKILAFMKKLDRWRSLASEMTTAELLSLLYEETGYYDLVGLLPSGEQQKANLRLLLEHAVQFEKKGSIGLFNFLGYVEKLQESGDLGEATPLGENEDVVRIMSIHKSKGLEFPVVFLCGCGKKFNIKDKTGKIILHQDMGLGLDCFDMDLRIVFPTKAKNAIALKHDYELRAEEMRLLYVAMTRAREKLIISGCIEDVPGILKKMYDHVHEGRLMVYYAIKAMSYFDWILPVLLRHPSMNDLRKLAGLPEELGIIEPGEHEKSNWQLTYKRLTESIEEAPANPEEAWEINVDEPEASPLEKLSAGRTSYGWLSREIARRLEWNYPFAPAARMPAKLTVSELKRLKETEEDAERLYAYIPALVKTPAFLAGKIPPTAAQKGSAAHFVLQNITLDKIRSLISNFSSELAGVGKEKQKTALAALLKEEIEAMANRELISREEASWVDPLLLAGFFMSPLGKRMLQSPEVKREIPFTMELGARDIYDMENLEETITLQGIIDCFFLEGDAYVLLDYKTDRISAVEAEEAAKKYEIQIRTYIQAVEKGTGIKVKEAYIYFLYPGVCVRMDEGRQC